MRAPMRRSPSKFRTRRTKAPILQVGINFFLRMNSSAQLESVGLSILVKYKLRLSLWLFKVTIFFARPSQAWARLLCLLSLSSIKLSQMVKTTNLIRQSLLAIPENWLTRFSKISSDWVILSRSRPLLQEARSSFRMLFWRSLTRRKLNRT